MAAAVTPILGLNALVDERVEWTLVGVTAIVGLVGHGRAYRRDHRHVAPGLIAVTHASLETLVAELKTINARAAPSREGQ